MKQAVGRLVSHNIHEGRALTLKVLKVRRTLGQKTRGNRRAEYDTKSG